MISVNLTFYYSVVKMAFHLVKSANDLFRT